MNIPRLVRVAERSTHRRYLHSALILSGGRFLASGYNSEGIHAEVRAINRLRQIYRTGNSRWPRNLSLISFQFKRHSGNYGTSFPCSNCWGAIKEAGIGKVIYFEGGNPCQVIL